MPHLSLEVQLIPQLTDNYAFLLIHKASQSAVLIDAAEADSIVKVLQEKNLHLEAIWNTHHHFDHIGANTKLKTLFPDLEIHASDYDQGRIPCVTHTHPLEEKRDALFFQGISVTLLPVPGHTLGHIAYFIPSHAIAFCGDTVFAGGCGRLFEGTAEQMENSLRNVIGQLPPTTQIYAAHEYTLPNLAFAQSIEPTNLQIQSRIEKITHLRNQELPSIPFQLKEEWETNPFFRVDQQRVIQTARDNGCKTPENPASVFAVLRKMKDQF